MTDRELAQQVIRGNHSVFAEIVHRYSGMVFSKALGVMHNEEGAAEVTQQTFVWVSVPSVTTSLLLTPRTTSTSGLSWPQALVSASLPPSLSNINS